jgi:hypothetical protein
MHAIAEEWTGRTLLIRLGPATFKDGDEWIRQVTVKDDVDDDGNPVGTIKGYAGKATEEVLFTIIRQVNSLWGLPARYVRRPRGRSPYWMRQISGVNGGKIIMTKKPSKHGIPDVAVGMKPDLGDIKKTVKDVFKMAHQGDVSFRGDVEVSDETALSGRLSVMSLADNEFFLYMVRSGDAAAAGVPLLSTARNPDGSLDVNKLEAGVNKGFAALESGKLQIHDLAQVDTTDKLRELADTITLDNGKELLGFVRVEN